MLEERWILDKQGCTWESGKSHTCSNVPFPHNSPVILLQFFIAKPAFLSRLAMHKISFCSPSHIKAPSRYADRSSREWRKLTNPPRLFLLKLAPQPVGSVSFHRTQTLTSLLKTPNLSRLCRQLANTTGGRHLYVVFSFEIEEVSKFGHFLYLNIYLYLSAYHTLPPKEHTPPYWIKTNVSIICKDHDKIYLLSTSPFVSYPAPFFILLRPTKGCLLYFSNRSKFHQPQGLCIYYSSAGESLLT